MGIVRGQRPLLRSPAWAGTGEGSSTPHKRPLLPYITWAPPQVTLIPLTNTPSTPYPLRPPSTQEHRPPYKYSTNTRQPGRALPYPTSNLTPVWKQGDRGWWGLVLYLGERQGGLWQG